MNERVRMVRDRLDLSRASFGEKLGVSGDVINNLERGRVEVKESMIKLICSVYSVNEKWLRTGEGGDDAMFVQRSEEDELAAAVDRLKIGQSAEFKRRLIVALSTLKEEHWLLLEVKLREIVGEKSAAEEQDESVDRDVENYRQRRLLEKNQAGKSSPSSEDGVETA